MTSFHPVVGKAVIAKRLISIYTVLVPESSVFHTLHTFSLSSSTSTANLYNHSWSRLQSSLVYSLPSSHFIRNAILSPFISAWVLDIALHHRIVFSITNCHSSQTACQFSPHTSTRCLKFICNFRISLLLPTLLAHHHQHPSKTQ